MTVDPAGGSPQPTPPQNPDDGESYSLRRLRQRAADSRRARDEAVAELREHLADEQTPETFGIDLSRLDED